MDNVREAILDFTRYLVELRTCTDERRREIRREGIICGDLLNATPPSAWAEGRDSEIQRLDALVGRVMSSTDGE